MTPGSIPNKLVSTPDWIRDANVSDDDLLSTASLDADDMSISDSSYDGEITAMFDMDDDPCDNTTPKTMSEPKEFEWTNLEASTDHSHVYPPATFHTPSPAISQETLKNDKDDTIRDVKEAADKIPPLLMRYCPDGTHCVATWNFNNCFHAETVVKIMLQCNISILVIQEPQHATTTANNGKFINKTLQKYGLIGYFSDFQDLIYNEAALGARLRNFKRMIGGRIITFRLQIGDVHGKNYINFTGCYGAAHGDHKYKSDSKEYKYGHTRNTHRTQVLYLLQKLLSKDLNSIQPTTNGFLSPKQHIVGEIILGDLQETISTTTRDNLGGIHYNPPKHGILNAIRNSNRHMTSVIREHEGQKSYITRESLCESRTGRGISHILVDPRIDDMYMGGCVDKILASGAFSTDHHIVAANFAFDMEDIHLQDREPTERFTWGRLANILMEILPLALHPPFNLSLTHLELLNGSRIWSYFVNYIIYLRATSNLVLLRIIFTLK